MAIGDVDELNAVIGVWRAQGLPDDIDKLLASISQQLFNLGGELSMPGEEFLSSEALLEVENAADEFNATLPPLKEFILPGGPAPVAWSHMARTVCRRAERTLWLLQENEELRELAPRYLNRLSDLFFVLGRVLAARLSADEVSWNHERR